MPPLPLSPLFEDSKTRWRFSDRFQERLPADLEQKNFRRQVRDAAYSFVSPEAAPKPKTVAVSKPLADELQIDPEDFSSEGFAKVFSGSEVIGGTSPYAMRYGGHQFGHWAGQLGDGRAINLGEIQVSENDFWTIQLKGAGPTPYSRTADGLAVLRSSVREFLCSEAMFHLGIPTTRALSLVETGRDVLRDMFYDGRPEVEPGAVVCRVAPSFLRFGNFQILTAHQEFDLLKQLADYSIDCEFDGLISVTGEDRYANWFQKICELTAEMVVHWMRVGFVHGVMNTDNMSILGLTIDYGPYGWIEPFDLGWTPNTTDAAERRYRFGGQIEVAGWNLYQFANGIAPLFEDVTPLKESLENYQTQTRQLWLEMMRKKTGLIDSHPGDHDLLDRLWKELPGWNVDMTRFFRMLSGFVANVGSAEKEKSEKALDEQLMKLSGSFYDDPKTTIPKLAPWFELYQNRIRAGESSKRQEMMDSVNPKYVLRNYLAQQAIDKATAGDYSAVERLLNVLENPYTEQPGCEDLDQNRPEWAAHRAGCSMLSCSS